MGDRHQHRGMKSQEPPANDIASESYQGPSGIVTGAGYVQIYHLAATIAAFVGAAIIGWLAHTRVDKIEKAFKAYAETNPASILGKIAGFIVWASQKVVEHIPFIGKQIEKNKTSVQAERWSAAAFAGGIVGGITWLGSLVVSFFYGAKEGNKGKAQFERAKNEIHDLRAQYDSLRGKYLEASTQLEEAQVKRGADVNTIDGRSPQKSAKTGAPASDDNPERRDDQKPGNVVSSVSRDATIAAQHSNAIAT